MFAYGNTRLSLSVFAPYIFLPLVFSNVCARKVRGDRFLSKCDGERTPRNDRQDYNVGELQKKKKNIPISNFDNLFLFFYAVDAVRNARVPVVDDDFDAQILY